MVLLFQTKNANVLGFCWTSWNEIVFITDQGIEYYQVSLCLLMKVRWRSRDDLLLFFRCFQTSAA